MITNRNCIARLSQYKNALKRLKQRKTHQVFSVHLGEIVGVSSAQVRKDFSIAGISGNKRGGYSVDSLIEELGRILGTDEKQKVVIVGAGKIGSALMKYNGFQKEGIEIVAAFDMDVKKIRRKKGIPVFPIEELETVVKKDRIKLGIIAVPDVSAQEVLDRMILAGITGVMNFAPISLKSPKHVVVNHVALEQELEKVIYFVNAAGQA